MGWVEWGNSSREVNRKRIEADCHESHVTLVTHLFYN
jgi:hypothetical protein